MSRRDSPSTAVHSGLGPTLALAALALAVSGCATGPDYERPALAMDRSFVSVGTGTPNAAAVSADIARFWRGFKDPALDTLIERGLRANGDIRVAQARLQEARANEGVADAQGQPAVELDTSAQRAVIPRYQFPTLSRGARTYTGLDAGFLATWELDLFGRARRGREAAAAQTAAGVAGLAGAETSVAAETARNYLNLRGLQERMAVAEAALVNQRESLRITQARVDAGRATDLDLARAKNLVESTEASLPAVQAAIDTTIFRLATLTATAPRALHAELSKRAPLPGLPVTDLAALPVGTPEQWMLRRPDLIAAERRLAAATANVGVTRADLFPRISLSGLLGLASGRLVDLGEAESARWSAGAGLSWSVLDFGRVRGRIAASEAQAQQALATYEQAVATALEETESAFAQFTRNVQRTGRLAKSARSANDAVRLARLRYEVGRTDFLEVLDAERTALASEDQLVQARSETAATLVAVYRALGGGWDTEAAAQASR